LKKLNRDTFHAETDGETQIDGRSWKEFLRQVLADEFQIRRAKAGTPQQKQNKKQMIAWIAGHPGPPRHVHEQDEVIWCNETLGAVTCRITFNGQDYQNIKMFKKTSQGQWQCVYWQVTQLTAEG
jgi:hypothetical protein